MRKPSHRVKEIQSKLSQGHGGLSGLKEKLSIDFWDNVSNFSYNLAWYIDSQKNRVFDGVRGRLITSEESLL